MSQEKVNQYKEYKKNRREILQKQKKKKLLGKIAAWAVVILFVAFIVGAIGYKIYDDYQTKLASMPTYKTSSYLLADMAGVLSTEEEAEASDDAAEEDAETEEAESEEASEAESEGASEAESETAAD